MPGSHSYPGETMKYLLRLFMLFLLVSLEATAQDMAFQGKWILMKTESSDLDYFQSLTVQFTVTQNGITIVKEFGPRRKSVEKMELKTGGAINTVPVTDATFMTNLYMGLKLPPQATKEVTATWSNKHILAIHESYNVGGSQGINQINVDNTFELSSDEELLTYRIKRSSRTTGPELKYVFKRAEAKNAYVYQMTDDWEIRSGLGTQACFISLQGIVNETKPNLYFVYGPKYAFNYTGELFTYLEKQKHYSFARINSLEQALQIFKQQIKGYIVWDKNVRTSLIVAYTLAGLEKGIVITEDLMPVAERMGLKQIEDFRGKFVGKTDYEIYSWAYQQYWQRCAKDLIVWLGASMVPSCSRVSPTMVW
jgi:hypothetical protein